MKRYETLETAIDLELKEYDEEQNIEVEFLTHFTNDFIEEVRITGIFNTDDNDKQIDLKILSNAVRTKIEDRCWDRAERDIDLWIYEDKDMDGDEIAGEEY